VTSSKLRASLRELETSWSFADALDAHDVLDALEAAEAQMAAQR
jgi:hypothetical protein